MLSIIESKAGLTRRLALICLCLLTILAYAEVRNHSFINFDDNVFVVFNPHINKGITYDGLKWSFGQSHFLNGMDQAGYWAPTAYLSHMIDFSLFGSAPFGPHITNLLIHVLNVLLVIYLLHQITGEFWKSFCVGAIFAVHPMGVESVAWIVERKGLLAALFSLLSLKCYLKYLKKGRPWNLLFSVFLFQFSLMSKSTFVFIPLLMFLIDLWMERRINARVLLEKIPFLTLSMIAAIQVILYMYNVKNIQGITWFYCTMNAFYSYGAYLFQLVYPAKLTVFYPHPRELINLELAYLSCVVFISIWVFTFHLFRRARWLVIGWSWFVISHVPTIGFLQAGPQARADRYCYFPMIGFFIIVIWTGSWAVEKLEDHLKLRESIRSRAPVTFVALVLVALTFRTESQVSFWKNSTTLFSQNISMVRENHISHFYLGLALKSQRLYLEADSHLKRAVELKPEFTQGLYHYAVNLYLLGDNKKALSILTSLSTKQEIYPSLFFYLGNIYYQEGLLNEAIASYQKAISMSPTFPAAYYNLGHLYFSRGQKSKALENYRLALTDTEGTDVDLLINTAIVMDKAGDTVNAKILLDTIKNLEPDIQISYRDMKKSLENNGDF